MEHKFAGKWITDKEFSTLKPRNVFHRQLERVDLPTNEHRNRHILFRKRFNIKKTEGSKIFITADDFYKLYINGRFVAMGPAPSYHTRYNYNEIDVSAYLREGENLIAVHTLYQGLINRVWQSGDGRHGLILDLVSDGETVLSSDESFKTTPHTAYKESGTCGYDTQFLESYDSSSPEVGFEREDYDDSYWELASLSTYADHTLKAQKSYMPIFEEISPKAEKRDGVILLDFGKTYVGYLNLSVKGKPGDVVTVRCAQELTSDGRAKYELRANCVYEEEWTLSGGDDTLDWFDYKAFRYAELLLPEDAEISSVGMTVRHYPFELKAVMREEFLSDEIFKKTWDLCINTQKYGVQEVIQDCMEREKGFYLGDGCYTALTHALLTDDDSMVRTLIDDAFSTTFISDTLVTCMNCSFMQEIAEYPLILVYLVLWHYRVTGDLSYLKENYPKVTRLLDGYKRDYEKDYLLRDLDKWCVVEWPANFRHGYDVDITEGKICYGAHISINAYYLEAIKCANKIAKITGDAPYRDETPCLRAFIDTFYNKDAALFRDGDSTEHISLVGNIFAFAFGLYEDKRFVTEFLKRLECDGISSLSMFCTFPTLMGLVRLGRRDLVKRALDERGAYRRMLSEDATTTFEGWGRETKKNASLFHMTMSYGALFLGDFDLERIFE